MTTEKIWTIEKVWIWMVALWLMAQAAFGAVKLWVLPGVSVEVMLIPTWSMAVFSILYGLWCLITAAVNLDLTLFDDDNQEETQCECKN